MKREKLPLKTLLKMGIISGSMFAITTAGYDYFNDIPFSLFKFLINLIVFGFVMAIFFRYKYTLE